MNKVLIVDDHPVIRLAVRMLMERHGYEVIAETDNGVDALQLAREHMPDIVILDIGIPKLDGLEVIARLNSMSFSVKVLVLTSQTPGHFSMRCMQAGHLVMSANSRNSPNYSALSRRCCPATVTFRIRHCTQSARRWAIAVSRIW